MQNLLKFPWNNTQNSTFSESGYLKVSGSYSFFLDAEIKGDPPYQSSTLVVDGFTKSDRKIAIPLKYSWFRIYNDRIYQLQSVHSNTYQLTAKDIGYTIRVHVISMDEDFDGEATVNYGPIRIEPSLRENLESMLSTSQETGFPTSFVFDGNERYSSNKYKGVITVKKDLVTMTISDKLPSKELSNNLTFKYIIDSPILEPSELDSNRLIFIFKGSEESFPQFKQFTTILLGRNINGPVIVQVITETRLARDALFLSLRCLATKTFLQASSLLSEIIKPVTAEKPLSITQEVDTLLELDSTRKELHQMITKNVQLSKDKEILQNNICFLEEELSKTIETYSKLLETTPGGLDNSTMLIKELNSTSNIQMKEEITNLKNQMKAIAEEKKQLQIKLEAMNHENLVLQETNKADQSLLQEFSMLNDSKMKTSQVVETGGSALELKELKKKYQKVLGENDKLRKTLEGYKTQNDLLKSSYDVLQQSFVQEGPSDKEKELRILNDMLTMENNTYKLQIESLESELFTLRSQFVNPLGTDRYSDSSSRKSDDEKYKKRIHELEKILTEQFDINKALKAEVEAMSPSMDGYKAQIDNLTKQRDNLAHEYQNVRNEYDEVRVKYMNLKQKSEEFAREYENVKKATRKTLEENEKIMVEKESLEVKIKTLIEGFSKKAQEIEALKKINSANGVLKEENEQLKKKLIVLEGDKENASQALLPKIRDLEESKARLEKEKSELQHSIQDLQNTLDIKNEEIIDLKQGILNTLNKENEQIMGQIDSYRAAYQSCTHQIAELEQNLQSVVTEKDRLESNYTKRNDELQTIAKRTEDISMGIQSALDAKARLECELNERNEEIAALNEQLNRANDHSEALKEILNEVADKQKELTHRKEGLKRLEFELDQTNTKAQSLQNSIASLKCQVSVDENRLAAIEDQLVKVGGQIELKSQHRDILENELQALLGDIEAKKKDHESYQEIIETIDGSLQEMSKVKDDKTQEFQVLASSIQELTTSIQELEQEKTNAYLILDNIKVKVESTKSQLAKYETELLELDTKLSEQEHLIEQRTHLLEALTLESNNKKSELEIIESHKAEGDKILQEISASLEAILLESQSKEQQSTQLQLRIKEAEAKIKDSETQINYLTSALQSYQRQIKDLDTDIEEANNKIISKTQEQQQVQAELAQMEKEIASLKVKRSELGDDKAKVEIDIEDVNRELNQELARMKKKIAMVNQDKELITKELEERKAINEKLADELKKTVDEKTEKETQLEKETGQLGVLESKIEEVTARFNEKTNKLNGLIREMKTCQEAVESSQNELKLAKQKHDDAKQHIEKLTKEEGEIIAQIALKTEMKEKYVARLAELKEQEGYKEETLELEIEEIQRRIKNLNEELKFKNEALANLEASLSQVNGDINKLEAVLHEKTQIESGLHRKLEDVITNNGVLTKEIDISSSALVKLEASLSRIRKELEELEAEKSERSEKISFLRGEIQEIVTLNFTLEEEFRQQKDVRSELELSVSKIQTEIVQLQVITEKHKHDELAKSSALQAEYNEILSQNESLAHYVSKQNDIKSQLEFSLSQAQTEIQALQQTYEKIKQETTDKDKELSVANETLKEARTFIQTLKTESSNLEKLKTELQDNIKLQKAENEDLKTKIETVRKQQVELQAKLQESESAAASIQTQVNESSETLQQLQKINNSQNSQIEQLHSTIATQSEELATLNTKRIEISKNLELERNQYEATTRDLFDVNNRIQELQEQVPRLIATLDALEKKKLEAGKKKQSIEHAIETANSEVHNLQERYDQIIKLKDSKENSLEVLNNEIKEMQAKNENLKESNFSKLQELNLIYEAQQKEIQNSEHKVITAMKQIEQKHAQLANLEKDLADINSQIQAKESEKGDYEQALLRRASDISTLKSKHDELISAESAQNKSIEDLNNQLKGLNKKREKLAELLKERDLELQKANQTLDKLTNTSKDLSNLITSKQDSISFLSNDLSKLEEQFEDLNSTYQAQLEKKNTLAGRLQSTQDDILSHENEIEVLSKHLSVLEKKRDSIRAESQELMTLESEISELDSQLFTLSMTKNSKQEEIKELSRSLETKAAEKEFLQEEDSKLEASLSRIALEYDKKQALLQTREQEEICLAKKIKNVEDTISRTEGNISSLEVKLSELRKSEQKKLEDIETLTHNIKEIKLKIVSQDKEYQNVKDRYETLLKDIKALKADADSLEASKENIAHSSSLLKKSEAYEMQVQALKKCLEDKTKEIENAKRTIHDNDAKTQELLQKYNQALADLKAKGDGGEKVTTLENKVKELSEELQSNQAMLTQFKKLHENLMEENANLTGESSELLEELEYYKGIVNENNSQAKMMKEIEKLKKSVTDLTKERNGLISELKKK